MGKELETWRALRHRRAGEQADEEAMTASALVGLKAELEKVDELIREKQSLIRFTKASILLVLSHLSRCNLGSGMAAETFTARSKCSEAQGAFELIMT